MEEDSPRHEGTVVDCEYVRHRNALMTRANLGELFIDYYLHLADHGMRHEPRIDQWMKDTLSAIVLHAAARPRNESIAWTIHVRNPLMNLFAAANNPDGTVVGQVFTDQVKKDGRNLFYSKVIRGMNPMQMSTIPFEEGGDAFGVVEQYYRLSEQRPGRFFNLGDEDLIFITAQPDCDLDWLDQLDVDQVRKLKETEEVRLLEKRSFQWNCGCTAERMQEFLAPTVQKDMEVLFEGEDSVRIHCPRCGVKYVVTRDQLKARQTGSTARDAAGNG